MNVYSLLLFGVVICLIAMLLKELKSNYGLLCVIGGAVIIILFSLEQLEQITDFLRTLRDKSGLSSAYADIIFRVLGICILGEISISVCNDSHNSTLASTLEILCKCSVLLLALPVFEDVLIILGEMLK